MAHPPVNITLGGNAATLIECDGLRVATDPWLGERIGPWRRLRPCGLAPEQLRKLDVLLISHAHPDHLDLRSLSELPHATPVLTPGGTPFRKLWSGGFVAARAMEAWDEWEGVGFRVTAVPCVHTRWALGFVLALPGGRIYFPGDAAPGTPFVEIGRRCGPIDVVLMPVGGSVLAPPGFQRHLTPAAAARATLEVGARLVVPIHWGHVPCVPAFLDRYRGTATRFEQELRQTAPAVRCLLPADGKPIEL